MTPHAFSSENRWLIEGKQTFKNINSYTEVSWSFVSTTEVLDKLHTYGMI